MKSNWLRLEAVQGMMLRWLAVTAILAGLVTAMSWLVGLASGGPESRPAIERPAAPKDGGPKLTRV